MKSLTLWLLFGAMPLLPAVTTGSSSTAGFEENRGQVDPQARYVARVAGQRAYFTNRETYLEFSGGPQKSPAVVRLSFPGANTAARWEPRQQRQTLSYFVGSDPSKWVRDTPQFTRLVRHELYPGIDIVYYGQDRQLEYDLVLAPNADPSQIRVRFDGAGAGHPTLNASGEIQAGPLRQRPPVIYQEQSGGRRVRIAGKFVRAGKQNEFRLQLGAYARHLPLVVDPVLEFATYVGGEADDQITAVGQRWMAGNTSSIAFPGATAARRRTRDVFVRIFSQQTNVSQGGGSTLILGGSDDDELAGAVENFSGNTLTVILAGTTRSRDFAQGPNSFTAYHGGVSDIFVASLDFAQFGITYSSAFLGGSGEDRAGAIAGNVSFYLTGTTDSADLPVRNAPQPAPGGGKDAFLLHAFYRSLASPDLFTYLGGSGDDSGLALAVDRLNRALVGGETRSPDFPLVGSNTGTRQGASDAFLARFTPTNPYSLTESRLIGGSGEDRIHALSFAGTFSAIDATQTVYAAGTTSSPDFPTVQPVQPGFGGDIDAFVLRTETATGALPFSTFLGGSGSDEGRALAVTATEDIALGGVTRSPDLPVVDPLQPRSGGNADGFLALLDNSYKARQITYYGGSGDDRILALSLNLSGSVRVAGDTNSPDLPSVNEWQPGSDSGLDGFLADIGTSYIAGPSRLALGKDMAIGVQFFPGRSNLTSPLTIRSSDPSKILFSGNSGSVPELTLRANSWLARMEAFSDSGEVTLELSAPGFSSKTVTVTLYPTVVTTTPAVPTTVTTWSQFNTLRSNLAAYDASRNQIVALGELRSGLDPNIATWSSSDPSVASVLQDSQLGGSPYFTPNKPGSTRLTAVSTMFPFWPSDGFDLTVRAPSFVADRVLLGQDLTTFLPYRLSDGTNPLTSLRGRGLATFRSSDPTKLLLAASFSQAGEAAVTLDWTDRNAIGLPQIYGQALAADGDVRVVVTSPELDGDQEIPVSLAPSRIALGDAFDTPGQLRINTSGAAATRLFAAPVGLPPTSPSIYTFRPGVPPVKVQFNNTAPAVLNVPASAVFPTDSSITLRPITTGLADIYPVPESSNLRDGLPLRVIVAPAAPFTPTLPSPEVGKDLQTFVNADVRLPASSEVVITVDDPSLALLAADLKTRGQRELRLRTSNASSNPVMFYVQGLASSGTTSLRLTAPGLEPLVSTIKLAPSGFAFAGTGVNVPFYATSQATLQVGSYLLDEATGLPLFAQTLRPGVQATIGLRADGDAVSLVRQSVTFNGDNADSSLSVGYTVRAVGTTTVSLDPPPGVGTPSRRASVAIRVIPSLINFITDAVAVKDGVTSAQIVVDPFVGSNSRAAGITLTSTDPARLLLSLNRADAGAASINTRSDVPIYLHGRADAGIVNIEATLLNATSVTIPVTLAPLRVDVQSVFDNAPKPAISMFAQSPARQGSLRLSPDNASFSSSTVTLDATAAALVVNLASSDPRIVSVKPETITFPAGSEANPAFQVTAVTPGRAEIRLSASNGVKVTPSTFPVTVAAAKLTIGKPVVGKDLQTSVTLEPESGLFLTDNVIATLTSLAPERLLLSRSATTPGNRSITIAMPANRSTIPTVYLQALAGEGEVTVSITADGFADSTATVTLVQPWLVLSNSSQPLTLVRGSGPTTIYAALVVPTANGFSPGTPLRPGIPPIVVPIMSDDPSVVALESPGITFSPGEFNSSFNIRPVGIGQTRLSLGIPNGFGDPGLASRSVAITVQAPLLQLSCDQNAVGKDAQISCLLQGTRGVPVSFRSSRPAQFLFARDERTVGTNTLTFTPDSDNVRVFLQTLAGDSTIDITASAPGFRDAVRTLTLLPSVFVLNDPFSNSGTISLVAGTTRDLNVSFFLLNSSGGFQGAGVLRPLAGPIQASITSSDAKVVKLTPATLSFVGGDTTRTVRLETPGTGSALVTLTAPGGFSTLPGSSTLLYNVVR